jgi:DNA-binding NarL/FixJ family response regulator
MRGSQAMIRVLVVDDHPVLRAGLEAVLRAEPGFVVVGGATDGREMQELVARGEPDVIVLDRHLAEEDGLELCRALRSRPNAPGVVLFTACDDYGLDAAARAAGAFAVVAKAADVDLLFDAVRLAARATTAVAPA